MKTLEQVLESFDGNDWDTWKAAKDCDFKKGDVFVLDLYGDKDNSTSALVRKAEGPLSLSRVLKMSGWDWFTQRWVSGKEWHMTGHSRVRFLKSSSSSLPSNNGCICRRCNARNEYAAPNQKDGSYLCFECRS